MGVVKDVKIYFNKEGVFGFKVIENFLLLNLLNIVVKEFVFLVFVNVINVWIFDVFYKRKIGLVKIVFILNKNKDF